MGGAQCPNFNSLTMVSLSAAVMSLAYSTIGFGASIDAGLHYTDRSKIDYTLNREPRFSGIFGVFNALGTARHRCPASSVSLSPMQRHQLCPAACSS